MGCRLKTHQLSHMTEIGYGFCQEIFTEKLNMHVILWSVLPVRQELLDRVFVVFLKMKLKLDRRRFKIVDEIQTESQAALDGLQEEDLSDDFEA